MLTNSELKQIKDYLALYGKKDSQLEAVNVDLDYPEVTFEANDYLSVVQDNKNKTIKIKDLEKVFLLTFLTDEDFREALKGKIPEEMLENACVTTEKLADGAVTTIKLGANTVTTAKIATGAITGDKIANNTIQGSAFAANSITTDKIVDGTITGDKLADGSIQSVDIKDNTLSGSKFVDGSISGSKIQDNVIESKHLLDNSIPASKIKDGSIESIDIKDGTLDGSKIKDNTIESTKLANNAITTNKIIDNSITTSKIANDAVTEDKIVDDSITAAKIANSSITTDKIVDEAITEDKLANGAVTTVKLADGLISEIQNITDAAPTTGSVKPVQSGGVKTAIDNVAFSTNEKVSNVGIDNKPTAGSDNLVKSSGVEDSIFRRNRIFDTKIYNEHCFPDIFESCIDELFIFPEYVDFKDKTSFITIWPFGGTDLSDAFAVYYLKNGVGVWYSTNTLTSTIQNGDIIEIRTNSSGYSNILVGYIIFKDIDTFRNSNYKYSSFATRVDLSTVTNIGNCPKIIKGKYNKIPEIIDNLNSNSSDNPLSAKQGKVLNEQDKELNLKIGGKEVYTKYQLPDDVFPEGSYYGYKNIGQYTKVLSSDIVINCIKVNSITINYNAKKDIQYKAYIVTGLAQSDKRDAPIGIISSSTHTLIQEGTLEIENWNFKDYLISIPNTKVSAGSQVVIYFSDPSVAVMISGVSGGQGNEQETSNCSLLTTSNTPWTGSWSIGTYNPSTNTGYFNKALTLLTVPEFYPYFNGKSLEENISDIEENISDIEGNITDIEGNITEIEKKVDTTDEVKWYLPDDVFPEGSEYSYKNIGQYTKVLQTATKFNAIRLNSIRFHNNYTDNSFEVRVYVVTGLAQSAKRDVPVGAINQNTHTLLGTSIFSNIVGKLGYEYNDYLVKFDSVKTCPAGSQVVAYLVSSRSIVISGANNALGNEDETSNVSLLTTNPNPWTDNWGAGSFTPSTNTGYFNKALTLLQIPEFYPYLEGKELEQKVNYTVDNLDSTIQNKINSTVPNMIDTAIDEAFTSDLKLTIPDNIYAVVGTELNLWNDAVSLSIDRGLSSPMNYQVRWQCSKGLITDRCFRYIPVDADANTSVQCTCYLYDMRNVLIIQKTFTIHILSKNALTSSKRIVYFGDSLGYGAANQLYLKWNNSGFFTGTIPTMLGTKGTDFHYEAVGGYTWRDYATAGRRAFRCFVSNVSTIELNSRYTNNGFTWTVVEVNITEGSGNILITKEDVSGTDAPETNGTLIPVSTGNSIPYTNATLEGANPIWNANTNQLDVALYRSRLGLGENEKIDAVSFQFGINDHSLGRNLTVLMTYISDLYEAFISDNPNCKFIIGLTTSSGNDVNGSGANYGATDNWMQYLNDVYTIRKFLLTLQSNTSYPNIRICPTHLFVDRYYGYALGTRPISQRTQETEKYHTNYVHPATDGYGQMGDSYFGSYIGALIE